MEPAERALLERSILRSMAQAALARAAADALPGWAIVQRRRLERIRRGHLINADDDARMLLEDQERVVRQIQVSMRREPVGLR